MPTTYPVQTVTVDGATITEANIPSTDEKAALAGSDGVPGGGNPYVTQSDPTNSDERTPLANSVNASTVPSSAGTAAPPVELGRPATGFWRMTGQPNANDTRRLTIANGTDKIYEFDGVGGNVNVAIGAGLTDTCDNFVTALNANSTDCTASKLSLGGGAFMVMVRVNSAVRQAAGDGITTISDPVDVAANCTTQDNGEEVQARRTSLGVIRRTVTAEDVNAGIIVIDFGHLSLIDYSLDVLTSATNYARIAWDGAVTGPGGGRIEMDNSGAVDWAAGNVIVATAYGKI